MSFLDDLAQAVDFSGFAADPKIQGVVVGRVINLLDPLMLGRVQVQIPAIDALDLSPWARVAAPAAGIACGFYWIPNLEDEVLVAFEQGDINAPYIIGCVWSAIAVPPLPSPVAQIRTPLGNQIIFTEAPPSITITTANLTESIIMTPAGIQIIAGENLINMTPDGVTINAPNINLVGDTSVNIVAPTVTINGTGTTAVGSPTGLCVISGDPVMIN